MRRIEDRERRARLAVRHHLASEARADDPVQVATDLVGIHATDPASVYLGALARTRGLEIGTMERALYEERPLLRIVGMRQTMFAVPVELAGIVAAACSRAISVAERRRVLGMIEGAGIAADPEAWLAGVEAATVRALAALGEATASELTREVPELGIQIPFGEGKTWAGTFGVSTRLLFLLAMEGRIIRGRPRGSWISSQYRWAPMDRWVPGGLATWPTETARAELVRRWLAAFGPGTIADLRWWTGWTLGEVRRAIAALETVEVELERGTGLVLADDLKPVPSPGPWIALLPTLDTTVMGWTARGWYLGDYARALFDRNGNAGPTVWCDGWVVGGWAQRATGEIAIRLLEDVGSAATTAIETAAASLAAWIGPVRITPRFRTPLEQEIGV